MKRYVVALTFTVVVVLLYSFLDVRFFTLGIAKGVRESLVNAFADSAPDEQIVVINLGDIPPEEAISKIETLLEFYPRVMGIDLCAYPLPGEQIIRHFGMEKNVVFSWCYTDSDKPVSSMVMNSRNTVTHFKAVGDFYELDVTGFKGRGNEEEMINYRPMSAYIYGNLADVVKMDAGMITGRVVLLGYVGDHISEEVRYYDNARITPLNPDYGEQNISPDMNGLLISANIVSTIINEDFINEVGEFPRILILLAIVMLNVVLLTYVRTRKIVWDILIALLVFLVMNMTVTFLIVYAFSDGYFLALNELTVCLLVTTLGTMVLNYREAKVEV